MYGEAFNEEESCVDTKEVIIIKEQPTPRNMVDDTNRKTGKMKSTINVPIMN
jgi:hypothetical protein